MGARFATVNVCCVPAYWRATLILFVMHQRCGPNTTAMTPADR